MGSRVSSVDGITAPRATRPAKQNVTEKGARHPKPPNVLSRPDCFAAQHPNELQNGIARDSSLTIAARVLIWGSGDHTEIQFRHNRTHGRRAPAGTGTERGDMAKARKKTRAGAGTLEKSRTLTTRAMLTSAMEELRKRFQSGRSAANLERSWHGPWPLAESHLLQTRPLLQGVVFVGMASLTLQQQ